VVAQMANGALNMLRLADGGVAYLSDPVNPALLGAARWNG
jgi:hypothetical protein